MLSNSFVYGQLKNFGTNAKHKPGPDFRYSVYGYYDVVREIGVGAQFQIQNKWSLDVSVYNVRSSEYFKMQISQWDYHDFRGYGLSLKPKWLLGPMNRFYVGLNLACEYLKHDIIWENYSAVGDHYDLFVLKSANGAAFNLGSTIGIKQHYKQLFIEPFLTIGISIVDMKSTIYGARGAVGFLPNEPYPYTISSSSHNGSFPIENKFLHFNIGIKVGVSFKNASQKREAINKKFDAVYIPKSDSLTNYFNTVGFELIEKSANLKVAFENYKRLNRQILGTYQFHYDTNVFYLKVNNLYSIIYQKINTHDAVQKKRANVYNPKNDALQTYFNTIDFKNENISKYLKKAYAKFKKTDEFISFRYRHFSSDTVVLYREISIHYQKIEALISKAKQ